MGACKSCTNSPNNPNSQLNTEFQPMNPNIKSTFVMDLKQQLEQNQFAKYSIVKNTQYSLEYSGLHRFMKLCNEKEINSFGTIKPINLERLQEMNSFLNKAKGEEQKLKINKDMSFKCGLELQDIFPKIQLNNLLKQQAEEIHFIPQQYTLIRSWGQGELMFNFEQAIEFVHEIQSMQGQLNLIGFTRGVDESIYLELVRSNNGWNQHQHYIQNPDDPNDKANIFDIYYNEQSNDVEPGMLMSALLYYGDILVWKRYVNEWEMSSDCDEVAIEVRKIVLSNQEHGRKNVVETTNSGISRQQYQQLKQFIQKDQNQSQYTRDIQIQISKKTIYTEQQKIVIYNNPIFNIGCSPKSESITQKLRAQIQNSHEINVNLWNLKLLKSKIQDLIKTHNLNVVACLEKSIKIKVNYEGVIVRLTPWEQANLSPYYKSTSQISQIKQWIIARDQIMPELEQEIQFSTNKVMKRINEMVYTFFKNIPTVEKTQNQIYGKIPYAEKRKPPYEEMSVSKSLGNEEIARKQNQILFLLIIDYENDDTLELLQKLIQFKKNSTEFSNLQIAVLGHIRAESWTKIFQAFMEKHRLNEFAESNIIETWFPIEDKIGSISFSAILSKMYGMALEKRDCLIVDQQNTIRVIDSSRRVIPNINKVLSELSTKTFVQVDNFNYNKQWIGFKKVLRDGPQISEICQRLFKQIKQDEQIVQIEQKQQKYWDFEDQKLFETKKHTQPTRLVRGFAQQLEEIVELGTLIQKQVDPREFMVLK